MKDSMT